MANVFRLFLAALLTALLVSTGCVATFDVPGSAPSASPGSQAAGVSATARPGNGQSPSPTPTAAPTSPAVSGRSGVILNPDGTPAPNVRVRGYPRGGDGSAVYETQTDENGAFTFEGAPDGLYNIEAEKSEDFKAFKAQVEVLGGAPVDLENVTLEPTGTITGKVTAPDAPGVTNFLGVDVFVPGSSFTAKTNQGGVFTLDHVAVGTFDVVAKSAELGTGLATGVIVRPRENTPIGDVALSVAIPRLLEIGPINGAPGEAITLTGENFGASYGGILEVSFNGTPATEASRTSDQRIVVAVPPGSTTGNLIVKVSGRLSNPKAFVVIKEFTLSPGDMEILETRHATYSVRAKDTGNQEVTRPSVTWTLDGTTLQESRVGDANVLLGLGPGDTTVHLAAGDLATQSARVHVFRIDGVDLSATSLQLNIPPPAGSTPAPGFVNAAPLVATVRTTDSRARDVNWRSSTLGLATVAGGLVAAVAGAPPGEATVTAESRDDPRQFATASVRITTEGNLDLEVR